MSFSPSTLSLENLPDGSYSASFNADSVLYDGTASQSGVTSTCNFTMGSATALEFTQAAYMPNVDTEIVDLSVVTNGGVGTITEKTENQYVVVNGLSVTVDVARMVAEGLDSSVVILEAGTTELELTVTATVGAGDGPIQFINSEFSVTPNTDGEVNLFNSTTGSDGGITEIGSNPYLLNISDLLLEIDVDQMKADQQRSTDITLEVNGTTAVVSVGIFLNIPDLPVLDDPGNAPALDADGFVLAVSGSIKKFRNENGSQIYRCVITDGQIDFHFHPEEE